MSRSSYSDDYGDDFPGQLKLYRANVHRSMRGRAGQQRLRELRDALLALPVKALEAETFVDGDREAPRVCALGAWALAKCGGDTEAAADMVSDPDADEYTAEALADHGWPRLVVMDTIYINDTDHTVAVEVEGPHRNGYGYNGRWLHGCGPVTYYRPETPEERYARVLAWVESHISADAVVRRAGAKV